MNCARLICALHTVKLQLFYPRYPACIFHRAISQPWNLEPRVGSLDCNWLRSPCAGTRIALNSFLPSAAGTALSRNFCLRKYCTSSLEKCNPSCCIPLSLIAWQVLYVTPLPNEMMDSTCWRRWSIATCSSYPWTTRDAGTGIINSLATFYAAVCSSHNQTCCRYCIVEHPHGLSTTG